ncbi:MAG: presqualene diphosphate synthase HpnD [Deltaproteobacteria bacterium]|nr:presqualene diphosphate synthase HpnD [Deltaproteobacteria bacterium]
MSAPRLAIGHCRNVLERSGSSFASAFRILPKDQRDAMTAFYAFCREVDDAVDEAPDKASGRTRIGEWRANVERLYLGDFANPVCEALGWAVRAFGIRREHVELVLDGVQQDLSFARFETFGELHEYCYRVAAAVGLVCVTVMGAQDSEAELYAELTGTAVQLTNIIRDVGEDAGLGRIYLPAEDLRAFGVTERDILDRRATPQLRALFGFEAARARHLYDLAAAALPPKAGGKLFFAEALRDTYSRLLDRLVESDLDVFADRVRVSRLEKLGIALKHRLRVPGLLRTAEP